uniref:Zinc transporter ZIP10 n=1 Tax=Mesocestoides corti TaxID=53468 RepID=A0A5K3EGZ7_MESCO
MVSGFACGHYSPFLSLQFILYLAIVFAKCSNEPSTTSHNHTSIHDSHLQKLFSMYSLNGTISVESFDKFLSNIREPKTQCSAAKIKTNSSLKIDGFQRILPAVVCDLVHCDNSEMHVHSHTKEVSIDMLPRLDWREEHVRLSA